MRSRILRPTLCGIAVGALAAGAWAAPVTYEIDPNHTYPSFEADHMGGLSKWRGKINSSSGTITLDKEAQTGTVEVTMDMKTLDFGHQGLNDHAQTPDLFDTAQFPTATYTGRLVDFRNGAPTAVDGTLTLHGVSKPVRLQIESFKCQQHPMLRREVCGADAVTQINREDFGITFGKNFGFDMGVTLRIQVEAIVPESS
ncbi:MAG TPA: YceI family protein [Gammaproteobacteria bacterium]